MRGNMVRDGRIGIFVRNISIPELPVYSCAKHKINKTDDAAHESVMFSAAEDMSILRAGSHVGLQWTIEGNAKDSYYESHFKFICHTSDQSIKRGMGNMWRLIITPISGFTEGDVFIKFDNFKVLRTVREEDSDPDYRPVKKVREVHPSPTNNEERTFHQDTSILHGHGPGVPKEHFLNTIKLIIREQKIRIIALREKHKKEEEALLNETVGSGFSVYFHHAQSG